MALFCVNRYMGTEDGSEGDPSDKLSQKLHEKAKAREKQRTDRTSKTGISTLSAKTSPRSKSRNEALGTKIVAGDTNTKVEKSEKSKKRRRQQIEAEPANEDSTEKSSVVDKKKQKRECAQAAVHIEERTRNEESSQSEVGLSDVTLGLSKSPKLKKKRKKESRRERQEASAIPLSDTSDNKEKIADRGSTAKLKISKKAQVKQLGPKGTMIADKMEVDVSEDSEQSPSEDQEEREDQGIDAADSRLPTSDGEEEEEESPGGREEDGKEMEDTKEEEEDVGFTVLGEVEERSKRKVMRVLPEWLSHPTIIEHDLIHNQVSVDDYTLLSPKIVSALKQNNISHLFPVQRHVIPIILDSVRFGLHSGDAGFRPRDLCVSAPTGSGKTLAFAVPIVQALNDRVVPRIRALAVLPTRDLASQVYRVFAMLCNAVNLRVVLLGGQKSFDKEREMLTKHSHSDGLQVDIVVATPGRLVDHINNTKEFSLQYLCFLVIDEADRMMEGISKDWIAQVEKSAYPGESAPFGVASLMQARPRPGPLTLASCSHSHQPMQKLLFSATLSQNPEKLTHLNLFQPRLVTTLVTQSQQRRSKGQHQVTAEEEEEKGEFVGKYTTPVGLTEFYIECSKADKPLVVLHLTKHLYCRQVLCFTNTVEATHRLYLLMKIVGGVKVAEFSSNLKPTERQQILKQFKAGKIDLLICSDAMARGMDIDNVRFVISYGLPPFLKTYIHRVGRTARAGKPGIAFSLLQKSEVPMFKSMLKNAGKTSIEKHTVRPGDLQPLMMDYEDALDQLPGVLKKENEKS